jgi:hypothetical protein
MFNLNFDICLVPFHVILTEIKLFLNLSKHFWNRRELAKKALLKWITITIFSRLLFQLVGWFDEVSCSWHTLCWKKFRHERVSPNHTLQHCTERLSCSRNIDDMWWQQDEAPSHIPAMQYLRKQFPGWVMIKGDDWPLPSLRWSNSMRFFSLGLFET